MGVVLYMVTNDVRRRRRALLVVTILVGLIGAVVLTALAGARRTDTAYDRLREAVSASDASIEVSPEYFDAIAALPQVESAAPGSYMFVFPENFDGDLLTLAAVDDRLFTTSHRPLITEGHAPELDQRDAVMVNTEAAERLGVGAGDTIELVSMTPEQMDLLVNGGDPGEPAGPGIEVTVAAIVRTEAEIANRMALMLFTPAFYDAYRDEVGHFDEILDVKLVNGRADLPAFQAAFEQVVPESEGAIVDTGVETIAQVEDAIRVLAVSLVIFALVVALAGFVAIGQALARQAALSSSQQRDLRTLGLSRSQRFGAMFVPSALVASGGAFVAAVTSVLASPLMPIGYARRVEPYPGLFVDWLVVLMGSVAIVTLVSARAAFSSWGAAGRVRDASARPSAMRATGALSRMGASLPALTGVRMALDPGRGRTAVPVRSAWAGSVAGVAGLVAAITFGAGLGWIVSEPAAYGLGWDASVVVPPDSGMLDDLGRDPDIDDVAALSVSPVRLGGVPLQAYGMDPMSGEFATVLTGRVPQTDDEVLVGSETLDRLGLRVGDSVAVARLDGEALRELTVVGRGVFPEFVHPAVPDSDTGAYNDFALLTGRGGQAIADPGGETFDMALVGFAPGVEPDAAIARLAGNGVEFQSLRRPERLGNLQRVHSFPAVVAAFLVLIAVAAVGHTLVSFVHRRAGELALLKSLGFVGTQVRASVAWQASTIAAIGLVVGIPVGVIVGRGAWGYVASGLGVDDQIAMPWLGIAAIVPGALLLVNVIAALPARRAARTRPALALRTE
ncbi:MAG: FtsX-like permease family protein [Actinomycetota bacterium]|nr:FtsX-like permease family protein [Actinomycetota bacterium]